MKFSIVVPAYNAQDYLPACLHSVRAQTFSDWELLVVDDGSTDRTGELLARLAAKDSRIRVCHQRNQGQFFARQAGIARARGDYLLFLDSDDALSPNCLEVLECALQKESWDMLLYTGQVIKEDGQIAEQRIGFLGDAPREIAVDKLRESLLSGDALNSLCTKAFHRRLFAGDDADYTAFRGIHHGEDKVRLLYPVTRARHIGYLPDALYHYHRRKESVTNIFSMERVDVLLAPELFPFLEKYRRIWEFTDKKSENKLTAYRTRHALSVYYGLFRACTSREQRRQFHAYPWRRKLPFSKKVWQSLGRRDRLRLFLARLLSH